MGLFKGFQDIYNPPISIASYSSIKMIELEQRREN